MAASMEAATAPAAVATVEEAGNTVEEARMLIGVLNLLSCNLSLPPVILQAVSSICHNSSAGEKEEEEGEEEMAIVDRGYERNAVVDGLAEVRANGSSKSSSAINLFGGASQLLSFSEKQKLPQIGPYPVFHQAGLPSTRGEYVKMKCLLELYGLKAVLTATV
ncbi:probable ATP-dependent DNA helicase CHR719 [Phragmites australis]|uniref:probable ATP-dependent DNA helicase CHR719 n=1 Tax=Phragmites australis TaxID=29695 RepID=UPI002D79DA0C|nr:probable ATP-dependent DNA helicase CHR719 [Phragmites australis]